MQPSGGGTGATGGTSAGLAVRARHAAAEERKDGGAPYQANRVVALLRRLFNLAARWGWR